MEHGPYRLDDIVSQGCHLVVKAENKTQTRVKQQNAFALPACCFVHARGVLFSWLHIRVRKSECCLETWWLGYIVDGPCSYPTERSSMVKANWYRGYDFSSQKSLLHLMFCRSHAFPSRNAGRRSTDFFTFTTLSPPFGDRVPRLGPYFVRVFEEANMQNRCLT